MNYEITKITLPSGAERYELRVWWKGRSGKQIKRRFASYKLASKHKDKLIEEEKDRKLLEENGIDPLNVLTFGAEHDYWLKHCYKDFSPGWRATVDGYWKSLKCYLEHATINQITPTLLDKIDAHLFEEKDNARKTINQKIGWIQSVLNFSLDRGRIKSHPVIRYKKPKAPRPDVEFWEREDAESFIEFARKKYPLTVTDAVGRQVLNPKHMRYLVYRTDLSTGLRAGELWGLRPRCLKRSLNLIRVTEQFNRVSRTFEELKGDEARSVPLNHELAAELERWIELNRLDRNDLVFSNGGTPIDHDNFADIFENDMKEWRGPRIKFHALRHTAATLMLLSNVDVKTVQEILGHKDLATTMRYLHVLGKSVADAAQKFQIGASKAAEPNQPDPAPQPTAIAAAVGAQEKETRIASTITRSRAHLKLVGP